MTQRQTTSSDMAQQGRPGDRAEPRDAPGAALARMAVADAERAGLLEGARSEHVSFRLPKALVDAARRESGLGSPTELGVAAFAMLARPDPVAAFQLARFGELGDDFDLEY